MESPDQPDKQQTKKSARYTTTLDGSRFSVVKYGVVEFLRTHKFWRATVAIVGITIPIFWLALNVGLKIPGISPASVFLVFILTTPELIWAAVVSGEDFELVFPTKDASQERQLAQDKFEESKAPEDALDLDLKRLNEYYRINQEQARSSFRWAIFSMLLGFATIIAGVWMFYFGKATPDTFMASLSTVAGIVVQLISGLFLHLHSKIQDRSLYYFLQLSKLQRVSIAIRLAEAHKNPADEHAARNLLIREILSSVRHAGDSPKVSALEN